jgi:aspartate/methionine/tyrosine aminotransferase
MKKPKADLGKLEGELAFEVMAKAKKLEGEGKKILHFEIGEPDFPTPDPIIKATKEAIDNGHTHYVESIGIKKLREAVCKYTEEKIGFEPGVDQVLILPGVKPGIFISILSLVDKNDEVIFPDPGFPTYHSMISYVGAKPVPVGLTDENNFCVRAEEISDKITERTKAIILNTPHNPTGGVTGKRDIEKIEEIARENGVWVISDEIYSRIVYEGKHYSPARVDDAKENTVVLDGFSKTLAMTGWRLGWMIGPREYIDKIKYLPLNMFSCTNAFIQEAGTRALLDKESDVWIKQMVDIFRKRRDVVVDGLNSIEGFNCHLPEGAFYAFPNVKGTGIECSELSDILLEKLGIATLPGTAFGSAGKEHLRFSYASSMEDIKEAIGRLKDHFNK